MLNRLLEFFKDTEIKYLDTRAAIEEEKEIYNELEAIKNDLKEDYEKN